MYWRPLEAILYVNNNEINKAYFFNDLSTILYLYRVSESMPEKISRKAFIMSSIFRRT